VAYFFWPPCIDTAWMALKPILKTFYYWLVIVTVLFKRPHLFRNIAAFMPLIFSLFTSLGVVFLFFHVTADLIILHISNMRQSFEDNRMRCVSKHPLFEVGLCIHYTHFFRRGEYRMTTVDNSHTISSEKIYILWMHRPTSNSGGLETQRIFSSCDRH